MLSLIRSMEGGSIVPSLVRTWRQSIDLQSIENIHRWCGLQQSREPWPAIVLWATTLSTTFDLQSWQRLVCFRTPLLHPHDGA